MSFLKTRYKTAAVFFVLGILAVVTEPGSLAQPASEPGWPLDLPTRYLTSNFMEYRGGRFHAGIDLKTNSETGYTVRAVEDGYISRVRATPFAYGRVVYQRGDSGKTYVYAHLMRFNDVLRARVQQAQEKAGTYRASLSLGVDEVRVRRGDVLGISGQSGTLGPHLHFEVRDSSQQPLNPMDHGFAVTDTFPPVIHSIRAWPVDCQAMANGSQLEQVIEVPAGSGRLPALSFKGPIAFSARMVDASDIMGHRLEPQVIEVSLDDSLVYRCQNEIYNFQENSLQRLEWTEWADWEQQSVREHWLHRRPANTLSGRQGGLWYLGADGGGLSPEPHLLKISAADHAGGTVTLEIPLVPYTEGMSPDQAWQEAALGISDPYGERLTPFRSCGNFAEGDGVLVPFSPSQGDPVLEDMTLLVAPWSGDQPPQSVEQGLVSLGPAAFFLTADWPIDSSVTVYFPEDQVLEDETAKGDPRVGVYRQNKSRQWDLVGPLVDQSSSGNGLAFSLGDPGLHAVMQDTLPPTHDTRLEIRVGTFQGEGLPQVTMPFWEVVPIFLGDVGSGVDPGSIHATLDERPIIVEPDLLRDQVLVELPDDLAPGVHRFYLEASDDSGNASSIHLDLICKESP